MSSTHTCDTTQRPILSGCTNKATKIIIIIIIIIITIIIITIIIIIIINETDDEIWSVCGQVPRTLKFISSRSHGKLFSMLLQAIFCVFTFKKM